MLLMKGSQSIGWRLASQESTGLLLTEETKFRPFVLPRNTESKSKYQRMQLYPDCSIMLSFELELLLMLFQAPSTSASQKTTC